MEKDKYLKKFNRCILEYSGDFYNLMEDGEEMSQEEPQGDMDQEVTDSQMGDDMQGGEEMPMDTSMQGGGEMPMGGEGVDGFNPQGEETPIDGMGSEMQDNSINQDDEVIDVDDLTKSQESAEMKIDKMNAKFEKLMGAVETLIKQNNEREKAVADAIANSEKKLSDELDKRVPTPQQRMSMRSTKSSPYSISPNEYMNNYAPDNYSDEDDNNGEDDAQYKITKGDIDSFTDYNSIAKELDIEHQGLHDILGF